MDYEQNVFVNCLFDEEYKPFFDAIVFTIYDCGFLPRSSREENDSSDVRLDKLIRLIRESRYGVHDLSRTELDPIHLLPRFNMPFELGLFVGGKRLGDSRQKKKSCLILDTEPYRYQKFISDLAGMDIEAHYDSVDTVIRKVRDWLCTVSHRANIPGGTAIVDRYNRFKQELPPLCASASITEAELTYNDYSGFVSAWLRAESVS